MSNKVLAMFMRVVVNGIGILFMYHRGYNMAKNMASWDMYKDEFLHELNKEEDKE